VDVLHRLIDTRVGLVVFFSKLIEEDSVFGAQFFTNIWVD